MNAKSDFNTHECNFYTQRDVETHNCEYDTDFNTHKSDLYTQSVMLTRISVVMTLTKLLCHSYVLKPLCV
jgi:hypothetical protein